MPVSLQAIYDAIDDIPEGFRELYTEKNGKFELTGITGVKTQADIDRLQTALTKERNDHKATKDLLKAWNDTGWKISEVQEKLDKYPELEAAAANAGVANEEKIGQLVEARIKSRLAPVERERDQLKTDLATRDQTIVGYQQKDRQRAIHDSVRKAATDAKVLPSAVDDALMLAERVFDVAEDGRVTVKDQVGFTPGIEPDVWLTEMQGKRPHWWPESSGGGSRGSKGNGTGMAKNPWSKEHWNLTEQGNYIRTNGMEKAAQMAELAGSKIGATAPATR